MIDKSNTEMHFASLKFCYKEHKFIIEGRGYIYGLYKL